MHSPAHHQEGRGVYLITSTCYEHAPFIGRSDERMSSLAESLTTLCGEPPVVGLEAWVVLPNHYHLLVGTESCPELLRKLGRLHGRTSRFWNLEEGVQGRKVWFNTVERKIESNAHHMAAIQYIHHNPVKHGHCTKWLDWKWSSAGDYINRIGREEAERRWREYPLLNMGKGWDD